MTALALLTATVPGSRAQYLPPSSLVTNLASPVDPQIVVSFNEPSAGTCQTVYSSQKQYTGYIRMPPYTLAPIQQNYSINYFFWYIEARQDPEAAPLTIYLNGGPGASSMVGLFNEIGPCEVVQDDDGTYGTQYRQWGWDRSSNILFIDQPNQVGFSYDVQVNATFDLYNEEILEPATSEDMGLPAFMRLNGTFGSASNDAVPPWATTANTTEIAARATWHFLQAWLSAFPQYNPATRPNSTSTAFPSDVPAGINLFAESYGGKYGSVFAAYFEEQNSARLNGTLSPNTTIPIRIASVGIINGMIDDLTQDYYYPLFAFNNTYGIQAISQTEELNQLTVYENECSTQIQSCRAAMASTDPAGYGNVTSTNALCEQAQYTCNDLLADYIANGYYLYDIRQRTPSPDPPAAYQGYLNEASVLASIGAEVNYTESNVYVQAGYISTGDTIRGGMMQDLAYLLNNDVRVALIYGDADYVCNWYGGEAVSLAVASLLPDYPLPSSTGTGVDGPQPYSAAFPAAGYAEIVVNSTYVGGAVRQYGNLSFSRIYDAGHFVGYFQPETAFTVFTRIIEGTSIATGEDVDLSRYGSTGPAKATYAAAADYSPLPTCWVRAWNQSCDVSDTEAMLAGSGTVEYGRFFLEEVAASSILPQSSVTAAVPGHPLDTGTSGGGDSGGKDSGGGKLTGVYTATSTPSSGLASPHITAPRPSMAMAPLCALLLSAMFGCAMIF